MPIPQLQKKLISATYVRDASLLRKKKAAARTKKQLPYDHAGRSAARPQRARTTSKKIGKIAAIVIASGFFASLAAAAGAYLWVSKDLASITDVEKRAIAQSTKIFARDEQTLLYEIGDNKRTDVVLDQINNYVRWATIALEDQHFYEHSGFKITSILRAVLSNTLHRSTQGASTLTQQFVKNAVLTSEKTYTRKLKELILAVRLERKYSKNEILNMYLNEIYYGANYQGVETAAREYLNKSAKDLSLAEAATLAALPQDPVDLPNDPERLLARRNYTLDQIAKLGYISVAEAEQAKQELLNIKSEQITSIKAPHFVFYVRSILEKKYGQNTVRKGGLRVVTTLDWDKQQKAEEAMAAGIPKIEKYGGSNAALVSLDAHNGQILAMVGSRDFFDDEHDGQVNVTTSLRQPGSSFKPVVYLTAFQKGYTPETKLYDVETDFPTQAEGKYHPRNYNMGERGPVTLRSALAQSLNIPAVKLLYLVGVSSVLDNAEQLGYTSFQDRGRFGLSLVLGGGEVTLLEHTASYAAFAREGEYYKPSAILFVTGRNGKTLEEWAASPRAAAKKEDVRILNSVLSDSGARSPVFGAALNLSDRPVAVKTGTTNDYHDAWTLGFTPSIATGVWVGNNNNAAMVRGADGSVIAAPIWKAYMSSVLQGTPVETFKSPSYEAATKVLGGELETETEIKVDSVTGAKIPAECLDSYPAQYVSTTKVKETHTILHYLSKNNPAGPAPANPSDDPMYEPWEAAVQRWAQGQSGYTSYSLPTVSCDYRQENQQPRVNISSFTPEQKITKKDFPISVQVTPGSGRTIVLLEFFIDNDILVGSTSDIQITNVQLVTSAYRPKSLTSGKHTVTVKATDDRGNFATDSLKITYTAEQTE